MASRDNTSVGSSGINLNTEYGKKIMMELTLPRL